MRWLPIASFPGSPRPGIGRQTAAMHCKLPSLLAVMQIIAYAFTQCVTSTINGCTRTRNAVAGVAAGFDMLVRGRCQSLEMADTGYMGGTRPFLPTETLQSSLCRPQQSCH